MFWGELWYKTRNHKVKVSCSIIVRQDKIITLNNFRAKQNFQKIWWFRLKHIANLIIQYNSKRTSSVVLWAISYCARLRRANVSFISKNWITLDYSVHLTITLEKVVVARIFHDVVFLFSVLAILFMLILKKSYWKKQSLFLLFFSTYIKQILFSHQ